MCGVECLQFSSTSWAHMCDFCFVPPSSTHVHVIDANAINTCWDGSVQVFFTYVIDCLAQQVYSMPVFDMMENVAVRKGFSTSFLTRLITRSICESLCHWNTSGACNTVPETWVWPSYDQIIQMHVLISRDIR